MKRNKLLQFISDSILLILLFLATFIPVWVAIAKILELIFGDFSSIPDATKTITTLSIMVLCTCVCVKFRQKRDVRRLQKMLAKTQNSSFREQIEPHVEITNNAKSRENNQLEPRHPCYPDADLQLSQIDFMEGHDFEYWCADLLRKIGFYNVEVTQGSGDQGVDILAVKDGIRYAIQCKCYSKDLGNTPVQEVSSGKMMPQYHCQVGAVMTNRYFTKGAQELAAATGTLLWDRDWIKRQLQISGSTLQMRQNSPEAEHFQHRDLLNNIMDGFFRYNDVSVSFVQKQFGIDHDFAAFILNTLEESGFIVQAKGSHPGYVNISYDVWQQVKNRPRNVSEVQ